MVKKDLAALSSPRSGALPDHPTRDGFLAVSNGFTSLAPLARLDSYMYTSIQAYNHLAITLLPPIPRRKETLTSTHPTSDASHRLPSLVGRNTECYRYPH